MDEREKNIFDYAAQVLAMFGFTMICMMCFSWLFGEDAKDYSVFFILGKEGVPTVVMLEFLFLSVFVTGMQYLFFTHAVIKKLSVLWRTVCMIVSILIVMIIFINIFDWFPIGMLQPWILFFLSFGICFIASMAISVLKTRIEERKLAEGLERLKKQYERSDKE